MGRWTPRRRPSGSIRAIVAAVILLRSGDGRSLPVRLRRAALRRSLSAADRPVTDDDDELGPPGSRRLTDQEKVVRAFLRDGRLVSIPARPGKRELLLPVILDRCFPEDRPYEEKEVNMRLALLHPDVAALRRYLIDGGLMTREAGIYRRVRPPD